jgi:hypothetical protein
MLPYPIAGSPGIRNQTPRADARAEARRRSRSESVETGFCERHAINARCRITMQSATYAEIYADMPTLCLDAPASAK